MKTNLVRLAVLSASALAATVSATQVTQDFTLAWDKAPAAFGSFSYDDALVPAGGGELVNVLPLAGLSIEIAGQSFDETDVKVVRFQFNDDRTFKQIVFGNDCDATRCSAVAANRLTWWVAFYGAPFFEVPWPWNRQASGTAAARDCSLQGGCRVFDDAYVFSGRVTSIIPEPSTYALLLCAIPLVVYAGRRRAMK